MKNSLGLTRCAGCYVSSDWNILTKCGRGVTVMSGPCLMSFSPQGRVQRNARHLWVWNTMASPNGASGSHHQIRHILVPCNSIRDPKVLLFL